MISNLEDLKAIEKNIETARKDLHKLINCDRTALTKSQVVELSQQLDRLILHYMQKQNFQA
ncbi:aspartyl-phosphate phosphatase Spo0E family protein [Thermotalea metallivorans]|uniref:Spo0E like sporulation regulatory protein n=1 Tax=Thermotalea metallivorans TaxID=520762 RepID=A0A140L3G7_9FIRM|nr:aspartyl-phosphate phosphatase Spo0E family protein [Thermotalea metallivorans]KXG75092.1 hypothetical protein AN619_19180 [Thermotalea metallivorans]